MKKVTREDNFYFLLLALLVLVFGCAVMQQFYPQGQDTVLVLIVVTLAFSIVGVQRNRRFYRHWYGFLLLSTAVSGGITFLEGYDFSFITLFALIVFTSFQIFSALKQVVLTSVVTKNHIVGSICIYLLLGLLWTFIYLFILQFFPNALGEVGVVNWQSSLFTVMYFSFITLTTVGYGDISPTLPIAQFFVFLESIIGSFYLAILVASLVSNRLSQSCDNE